MLESQVRAPHCLTAEFSSTQSLMTALAGQSLQPRQAGPSKLFLAHNQVSPRFGPTQLIPIFLGGRHDKQEGDAHRPSSTGVGPVLSYGMCEESVGEPQWVIQRPYPSQRKQPLTVLLTIPREVGGTLTFFNIASLVA